ncbi:MAG: four helix bundle protein [Ignavibacteria bacterium]|nr:four helix bundle protein [Ignavibacteria bacterium]
MEENKNIYNINVTEEVDFEVHDSSFEDLVVWSKARELRIEFEKIAKDLPSEEKYILVSQILRASRSVTSNIAEGYGRFHFQENIQFCRHSRGSLYELMDQLIVLNDNKYINSEVYNELKMRTKEVIKILNGYINFLIKQKENSKNK